MCKVSIIIPSYNSAKYLGRCINSCLLQTFSDYEIVILDDGSSDNTVDVVNPFLHKYENIKLVSKIKNEGLVCARQTALEVSKGEFVLFVDADDTIEPDTLQKLVFVSEGADIVIGGVVVESMKGKQYPIQRKQSFKYGKTKEGMLCNYLSKVITPSLCGRLIRKEYLVKIGTPPESTFGEDVITNLLLLNKYDLRIQLVDGCFYHYIQYPFSMFNSKSEKSLRKRLEYIHWVLDFMKTMKFTKNNQVNVCFSRFLLGEFYSFLRDGGEPNLDTELANLIFTKYWDKNGIKDLPVWQFMILSAYRLSPSIGKLCKTILLTLRSTVYYFKLK